MASSGMRAEALKLKEILNEKYKLDVNYTSSLRIIEELRNSKSKVKVNDLDNEIFMDKIPLDEKVGKPINKIIGEPGKSKNNSLTNNIKNINSIALKSKEKVLYFNLDIKLRQERFSGVDEQGFQQYGEYLFNKFLKNFDLIEFNNLEDFIKLSESELNVLLNSVDKIFFTPFFYNNVDEELFIKLIKTLSEDKFVAILDGDGGVVKDLINNILYEYKNNYGNKGFYILKPHKTLSELENYFEDFNRAKGLYRELELSEIYSKNNKVLIGVDGNNEPISWSYIDSGHLYLKDSDMGGDFSDSEYLIEVIENNFKKFNKNVEFYSIKDSESLYKVMNLWNNSLKLYENSKGEVLNTLPLKFLITYYFDGLFEDENFNKILRLGRSMGYRIILIDDNRSNTFPNLNTFDLIIKYSGGYSVDEFNTDCRDYKNNGVTFGNSYILIGPSMYNFKAAELIR